ncbi:hypothetical protein [Pseudodesulfovibrio senegalensis]|uniref:Uncharacterized protein n=1 Tax=Pseudodesulfovibrio senegalensis TaxID=1721087 RepID=A0A6N6N2E1_9BACT|nr:hypothetical protein [Pseudodesulfovibrio senegalensis]KAB1441828.1 hypothetical protein F8A88_09590 [Pseudodesulfovibrio senegalensis]
MTTRLMTLTILSLFLASGGCSIAQVQHEESTPRFGSSVKMAVQDQTLNPLPAGTEPVRGMDGKYTQAVVEKYQSGPKPETKSTNTSVADIIIGGK